MAKNFSISPEDCIILRAFRDQGSLRGAARMLQCDPAGLLRKVRRIAADHGFIQNMERGWHLTAQGQQLVVWVEESMRLQELVLTSGRKLRLSSTQ